MPLIPAWGRWISCLRLPGLESSRPAKTTQWDLVSSPTIIYPSPPLQKGKANKPWKHHQSGLVTSSRNQLRKLRQSKFLVLSFRVWVSSLPFHCRCFYTMGWPLMSVGHNSPYLFLGARHVYPWGVFLLLALPVGKPVAQPAPGQGVLKELRECLTAPKSALNSFK